MLEKNGSRQHLQSCVERTSSHATDDISLSLFRPPLPPRRSFLPFHVSRGVIERISGPACLLSLSLSLSLSPSFSLSRSSHKHRTGKQIIPEEYCRSSQFLSFECRRIPQQRKRVGKRKEDRTTTLENGASHAMNAYYTRTAFFPSFVQERLRVVRKMPPFPVCDSCPSRCRSTRSTLTKMYRCRVFSDFSFAAETRKRSARTSTCDGKLLDDCTPIKRYTIRL